MNRREKSDLLRQHLQEGLSNLEQSISLLEYSFRKCSRIPSSGQMTPGQLESFEAFCARFARSADILVQKVFSTVFLLLKEPQASVIDKVHRAEKLGFISSAEILLEIRDVRNEISHEYAEAGLLEVFKDVAQLTPELKKAASQTTAFARLKLLRGSA